ncbi:MAG: hypothetical protein ACYC46_00475 [Acidobacteriaceae bacterium]
MEQFLWFFTGSILGASIGFITAVLCIHSRAESLAQQMLQRRVAADAARSYAASIRHQVVS